MAGDGEFDSVLVDQIRVLDLVDGQYRQRLFRQDEDKSWVPNGDVILPEQAGVPMDFIPFRFIGPRDTAARVTKPPFARFGQRQSVPLPQRRLTSNMVPILSGCRRHMFSVPPRHQQRLDRQSFGIRLRPTCRLACWNSTAVGWQRWNICSIVRNSRWRFSERACCFQRKRPPKQRRPRRCHRQGRKQRLGGFGSGGNPRL